MECYYHPDRNGTDTCAICGKSVCKECGLEIAGKTYCKDCLEKIVGIGLSETANESNISKKTEPARLDKNTYKAQEDYGIYEEAINQQENYAAENKAISDESPYNIKSNIEYSERPESSYTQKPQKAQITDYKVKKTVPTQPINEEYAIYPEHNYDSQSTRALEDKYERYLDDLYFDEEEISLGEQLAKDEEKYGSLTRKEYKPQTPTRSQKEYDEIEERIRREIARERGELVEEETSIHNLNYHDEKEPMSIIDIILIIILILLTLLVVYYIIYLFILNTSYPTFMDALYGLTNPLNVINNLVSK